MTLEQGYSVESTMYADFRPGEEVSPEKLQAIFFRAERDGCTWVEIFSGHMWVSTYQNASGKWILHKQSLPKLGQ